MGDDIEDIITDQPVVGFTSPVSKVQPGEWLGVLFKDFGLVLSLQHSSESVSLKGKF